jgi:hypothetical protein
MNYVQLRAAIQQYSQDFEASFTQNIDTFIRLTESRIALRVRLPNSRLDVVDSLTAQDNLWTVPEDFLAPDSVIIKAPWGFEFPLNKDPEFLDFCYPDPLAWGVPRFYAYLNNTSLKFAPTPDQNYPFRLAYFTAAPSIVDVGHTWLGDQFAHSLVSGSLVEAAKYQKQEDNLYARYDQAFEKDLAIDQGYAKGRSKKDTQEEPDKRVDL